MARKLRTALIAVAASFVFLNTIYHHLLRHPPSIATEGLLAPPLPLYLQTNPNLALSEHKRLQLQEQEVDHYKSTRHVTSLKESTPAVSILLPAWEILVVLPPETPPPPSAARLTCLFPNNISSTARPSGFLSSPYRTTFKCDFPARLRRRFPFPQPVLNSPEKNTSPVIKSSVPELLRWNFLVYDSITTEDDVVLFVKGLNHRQGSSRSPSDFACVFGDDVINGVKTAVTSSVQEVFRCRIPKLTAVSIPGGEERIKISLEISEQNRVVPSVAYYTPPRNIAIKQPKSLLCACTMVYNVAKFLREWVIYHSAIGVERFILYDNGSDDELDRVVEDLIQSGYDMTTTFWVWAKTQESGFSHCAVRAKDTCKWVTFIDVDEFIYSRSWLNSSSPSREMLQALLPKSEESSIGQIMIGCYEFGPSNQKSNPKKGVIQGYNCRRRDENRHKSIVLLDAIDESLLNVIHHFRLKQGYKGKKMRIEDAVVNHYKYQAWVEFKTKFRRRVSAYVADWTQAVNPASKDRTPGLGYAPVEPYGWEGKFCEVYDNRLRDLTRRWFEFSLSSGYRNGLQES